MCLTPDSAGSPRPFVRRSSLAVVLAILALLARPGAQSSAPPEPPPGAGDAQDAPPGQPTFRIEANFVRVDAYPTIDGKPVRDLKAGDFELLEDGRPQTIETFEHVEVRGFIPQEERREPQAVAQARAMAEDPRSRVFVIFLDTYHTQIIGSHRMRSVLIDLLNRVIGPDDLFGVMTPQMSAGDVTLARRTTTIESFLTRHWAWGRRDRWADFDEIEALYDLCYGRSGAARDLKVQPAAQGDVARAQGTGRRLPQEALQGLPSPPAAGGPGRQMMDRRRERMVLDALKDLSMHLGGLREERKAVIVVSDGWALHRPDPRLAETREPTTIPRVGVGPDGRITTDEEAARNANYSRHKCDQDRQALAMLDNWQAFYDVLEYANRFNVSFYPIDSRGLPASDAQIWEDVPPRQDQLMLNHRVDTLRGLAENTDGLAVVNSNDLHRGVRRIVDDLSSYYLLGYYSTSAGRSAKPRAIRVRVKRPGVEVRARRSYRPVTEEEIAGAREMTAVAAAVAPASLIQTAIAGLDAVRPDSRFLTRVSWIAAPPDDSLAGAAGHVWLTAELDAAAVRDPGWASGAEAQVLLEAEDGVSLASEMQALEPPVRVVDVRLSDVALGAGDHSLRVRLRPAGGGLPYTETLRFTVPDVPSPTGHPRLLRRGQTTGQRFVPTADPRFRRHEWLRVEVPVRGAPGDVHAELLDRTGHPLPVPVTAASSAGEGGLAWASAELSLAPLAPGDYAVRTTLRRGNAREERITAFRVIR